MNMKALRSQTSAIRATAVKAGRFWSLLDMINFHVGALCAILQHLQGQEQTASGYAYMIKMEGLKSDTPRAVDETTKNVIGGFLELALKVCDHIELDAGRTRVALFRQRLMFTVEWDDFASECRALREAIEGEIKTRHFFYFERAKADLMLDLTRDWAKTFSAFPSAKPEIESAVSCFAYEQETAAVFHLMRAVEFGLRAIAKERRIRMPKNKPLEWANWGDIIGKIEDEAEAILKHKPAGRGKDRALAFYNGALHHMSAFKDKYRNSVMHTRVRYDEEDARSALSHVREFMNDLSAKLNEKGAKPIRWRF